MNRLAPSMIIGKIYNFKYQTDYLEYIGKASAWHQFKKLGDPRPVWAELLTTDLSMIEPSDKE